MTLAVRKAERLEGEVKKRTNQITQLLQQKKRIIANISHEFRTPLTLILLPIKQMLERAEEKEERKKLYLIQRNGHRLLSMVEQLISLSKISHCATNSYDVYSVKSILMVLEDSFRGTLDNKCLSFSVKMSNDIFVKTRQDVLETILINLISNAVKYTNNGEIIVSLSLKDEYLFVKIIDTGIGIDIQEQSLIFDAFYRAKINYEQGAGLGLAIVKELIEEHQGKIWLESEINKGSVFSFYLPNSTEEKVLGNTNFSQQPPFKIDDYIIEPQVIQTDGTLTEQGNKKVILLIDDNADILYLLEDILSKNYQCILCQNSEEAVSFCVKQVPDLVLCDVMMPIIDGFAISKKLREHEITCHIPIILLTANDTLSARKKGWKLNVDEYLVKPFDEEELLLRIESILSVRNIIKKKSLQYLSHLDEGDSKHFGITEKDKAFIKLLHEQVLSHYQNDDFSRIILAKNMAMSERQLHRKMEALVDLNFTDYLRNFRLTQSIELLKSGNRVTEVCFAVGFSSTPYFGKCFKAHYGVTPKQYLSAHVKVVNQFTEIT
jgi:CheY-like chemotaxis protein